MIPIEKQIYKKNYLETQKLTKPMENDFKKIKLNALYQKQESDELRNKWKNLMIIQ